MEMGRFFLAGEVSSGAYDEAFDATAAALDEAIFQVLEHGARITVNVAVRTFGGPASGIVASYEMYRDGEDFYVGTAKFAAGAGISAIAGFAAEALLGAAGLTVGGPGLLGIGVAVGVAAAVSVVYDAFVASTVGSFWDQVFGTQDVSVNIYSSGGTLLAGQFFINGINDPADAVTSTVAQFDALTSSAQIYPGMSAMIIGAANDLITYRAVSGDYATLIGTISSTLGISAAEFMTTNGAAYINGSAAHNQDIIIDWPVVGSGYLAQVGGSIAFSVQGASGTQQALIDLGNVYVGSTSLLPANPGWAVRAFFGVEGGDVVFLEGNGGVAFGSGGGDAITGTFFLYFIYWYVF